MPYPSCFQVENTLMIADYKGYIFIYDPDNKTVTKKMEVIHDRNEFYCQVQFDYEENNSWDTLECFLKHILLTDLKGEK